MNGEEYLNKFFSPNPDQLLENRATGTKLLVEKSESIGAIVFESGVRTDPNALSSHTSRRVITGSPQTCINDLLILYFIKCRLFVKAGCPRHDPPIIYNLEPIPQGLHQSCPVFDVRYLLCFGIPPGMFPSKSRQGFTQKADNIIP